MRHSTIALLIVLAACLHSPSPVNQPQVSQSPAIVPIGTILQAMAGAYQHKVIAGASERVQIDIHPEKELGYVDRSRPAIESWQVIVTPDRKVTVAPGPVTDPTYFVFTTRTGLQYMYEGRYNVMTTQLRSRGSDPSYLEYTRAPGIELTQEVRVRIRNFIHFFDVSLPHRYVLSTEHSRTVHGAGVVGLYYYPGLRGRRRLGGFIVVKSGPRTLFIRPEDVDWIESAGNYIRIHHRGGSHLLRETMNGIESRLPEDRFARIQRTVIVNLDRLAEVRHRSRDHHIVVLQDGRELPLGKMFRAKIEKALGRF